MVLTPMLELLRLVLFKTLGWENNVLLKTQFMKYPWVDLCFTQDVAKNIPVVKMEMVAMEYGGFMKCTLCPSTYVDQPYPMRPHYPHMGWGLAE